MHKNRLIENLKNINDSNISKNNLFDEFTNSVKTHDLDSNHCEGYPIVDNIRKSIKHTITENVNRVIRSNSLLLQSKNVAETTKSIENILKNSNFGTFEYEQKTGKNFIRVTHSEGYEGTEFLKIFFENVFNIYLKNYSFHVIFNECYVCVIFR